MERAVLISDPFGTVNGSLSEDDFDVYEVQNTSDVYAFLKLTADDPNLLAALFFVNSDGTLGDFTGFGVLANQSTEYTVLPTGEYAIVIVSADESASGSYSLHVSHQHYLASTKIYHKL